MLDFMRLHPKVRVELESNDRPVNLIEERFDIALQPREGSLDDSSLVTRRIASGRFVLVAPCVSLVVASK
jgi:DNA-binding transcriptional LysR family regulator